MRQCTVKPAWIGHALKRRPCWEGQTRLIPSVFYMLSYHVFLNRKTVKRTLLQTDNIVSSQIKKHPYTNTNKNFRNFRETELNSTFLSIFSKRNIFCTLKQQYFFFSFCSFEGVQHFWLEFYIFFSKLLSATNQQLFSATQSNIGQGPSNHSALLYELMVSVL